MQAPPFPHYLVPPRSKYSPQHHGEQEYKYNYNMSKSLEPCSLPTIEMCLFVVYIMVLSVA